MELIAFILVCTGIRFSETWAYLENDQFDLLENWGISRVRRQEKMVKLFPEEPQLSCNMLHETEKTPFVAIVLFRTSGRLLCMGSIVDQRHVLSAKRCYERADVNDLLVLVGYYKAYWGRHAQVKPVKKILRHEYEMAMLRLSLTIKFTVYVQPVRLPPSVTKMELDFAKTFPPPYKVVGFFVDRYDVPGEYIDKEKIYQIKEDKFIPFDDCKANYSKLVLEPTKLYCVLGNATYCWGGWGAPVLKWIPESAYFLQVGVAVADNCTTSTTGPLLIARTDVYGDWIRGNSFHGHQPT